MFVQHRVWKDRAEIAQLFRDGAQFYVCGDGEHMAPGGARDVHPHLPGARRRPTTTRPSAWADRMEHEHGRYVSDVFA